MITLTINFLNPNLALADFIEATVFYNQAKEIQKLIDAKAYAKALLVWDKLILGEITQYPTYFNNITGLSKYGYINYLFDNQPVEQSNYLKYLARADFRKAVHVGQQLYREKNPDESTALLSESIC